MDTGYVRVPSSQYVAYYASVFRFRELYFLVLRLTNLLVDRLTPYESRQGTEVLLSLVKLFSSKILLHVCLARGSAERCDTQRLNKAIHGLRGEAIICLCDSSRGRM